MTLKNAKCDFGHGLKIGFYLSAVLIVVVTMSSNVASRFAKRKSQFKARGGTKQRAPRTSINTLVKRALSNAGAAPQRRVAAMSKEIGYVDVANTSYAFDTTGSLVLLNTVPQGAGISQRVGKKYRMTSLQFRGYMANGTTATINDIAMLIVYDKRPTGSLPAITDILNSASANAQNKDDNVPSRFQILKRVHTQLIGNVTTPATGLEMQDADFYMSMRLPVVCKALGTGAIGDIEEGALYLITVGNNAAGTAAAGLTGTFRVRFVDT